MSKNQMIVIPQRQFMLTFTPSNPMEIIHINTGQKYLSSTYRQGYPIENAVNIVKYS